MTGIDFRAFDARERGLSVPRKVDGALEFDADPALAQRIREGLDKHCEDAAFDAAERRMREGIRRG